MSKSPNLSRERRLEPRGSGRGRIGVSSESKRYSIGKLSKNQTNDGSLNSDGGTTCNANDEDWGGGIDEVGSGSQNYVNSAEVKNSINNVENGEREDKMEEFWKIQ